MQHSVVWVCALVGAVVALSFQDTERATVHAQNPIRVLAWSERTEPADVYPQGINGAIAEMLKSERNVTVKLGNITDPNQGLDPTLLNQVDVLVWFGHQKHKEVTDENVELVVKNVKERGMGYLPLHSAHYARPFQRILVDIAEQRGQKLEGTPGKWAKVKNEGRPELIHVLQPKHPIAKGVKDFTIPKTETYWNPFVAPAPDVKILEGRYEGDMQDGNDGLLWNYGKGKVFYFRPGHETYPIYFQPEVQQILKNAIRYLASKK